MKMTWSLPFDSLFLNALAFALLFLLFFLLRFWSTFGKHHTATLSSDERVFLDGSKHRVPFPAEFSSNKEDRVYLSIIAPAYNEEKRLDPFMEEAMHYLTDRFKRDTSFTFELIVVSDGSKDKTVEVAHKWTVLYPNNVRVLNLVQNRGKGGAVKRGVMVARGDYVLMADADGATKFSDFELLEDQMQNIEKNNHGLVVGSRAHLQSAAVAKRTLFRNVLMWGFHLAVQVVGGVHGIQDTQCGFKLFARKSAHALFYDLHLERWAFDVELLWLAQYWRIPIAEVAVNWAEIAGSHLEEESTALVSLKMLKDMLVVRLSYLSGYWFLHKELL